MKPTNIYSLMQAASSLNEEAFELYLEHHEIKIRKNELNDLETMITTIKDLGAKSGDFDKFYVGYKIPQIGKEFDLLRFGEESTINIELKSSSNIEQIKSQLLRNKYYLSFIQKSIQLFTFESSSKKLYYLDKNNNLEEVHPPLLLEALQNQTIAKQENPDLLFDPSSYLVSPFNSTEKFLDNNYFLTSQQENFKKQIIKLIESKSTSKFISITGSAGTGKTLLTFDIAKHFIENQKNILIIHCGYLNDGHEKLKNFGWRVCPIKSYTSYNLTSFDVVIIDEAQRLKKDQLTDIINKIRNSSGACIFSYDKSQTLATWENGSIIANNIENIQSSFLYNLSEKIRTNLEVSSFIKGLFQKRHSTQIKNSSNIKINYFKNVDDAKSYLNTLKNEKWQVLRFTPSQYNKEYHQKYSDSSSQTSHQVIGQEFENVAITIDKYFSYDEDGNLTYDKKNILFYNKGKSYYNATKMLLQNITRARKMLNVIIIDNPEILIRCLKLLTNP